MTSKIKEKETLGLYGNFGFSVYDKGKLVLQVRKKNQITNEGRTAMLNMLHPATSNENPLENQLWSLSIGTNPTPPTVNDDEVSMHPTASGTSVVWTSILDPIQHEIGVTLNPYYMVEINKTLPTTAAVGAVLTEAGLFTRGTLDDPTQGTSQNRRLYARQVHSPITKTNNMQIVYTWQLGITVVTHI